eukprot:CAMPEP_0174712072 /NCGR_PEP_ID=MMETSP1094-20130205/13190_1 /TAXON_ID=156173 /ORGANISM="Chrysochromulina brevifilum, Strain UTEX LB 985" /LENGTH=101 /DNA_ID=CAMNT_0015911089 /DNA_START=1 /DNA_END=306 /DNA_ORIENTATION=-
MRSHGVRIRSVSTLSMLVGLQQATRTPPLPARAPPHPSLCLYSTLICSPPSPPPSPPPHLHPHLHTSTFTPSTPTSIPTHITSHTNHTPRMDLMEPSPLAV